MHEHHRDHRDDGEQRGEQLAQRLLQALRDVVDVVGDAAEQLAARLAVEVRQRQPVELVLDVAPQAEDRAVDRAGEDPALRPRQHGARRRRGPGRTAGPGRRRRSRCPGRARRAHRREHVGEGVLPARAQRLDRLLPGSTAGRELVRRTRRRRSGRWRRPRIFGPDRRQRDAGDGEGEHAYSDGPLGLQQAAAGAWRTGRSSATSRSGIPIGHVRAAPRRGRRRAAPGLGRLLLLGLHTLAHAAASSRCCCDSTISTYVGQRLEQLVVRARCRRRGPSSRTTMWSASTMVDTRWATTMTARMPGDRAQRRAQPRVGGEVEGREGVVEEEDLGLARPGPARWRGAGAARRRRWCRPGRSATPARRAWPGRSPRPGRPAAPPTARRRWRRGRRSAGCDATVPVNR